MKAGCFQDGVAGPSGNFLGAMVIDTNQTVDVWPGVVANRSLFLDYPKSILLEEFHEFAKPHLSHYRRAGTAAETVSAPP